MDYGSSFTWDDKLTHAKLLAATEEAQAIARAAEEAAEQARIAAERAEEAATQARDLAQQAADVALQYEQAIAEARALAEQAGESAASAGQTAEEALTAAGDAASAAATAQGAADAAQVTADAAQSAAQTAQAAAGTAQDTADSATSAAQDAQNTADAATAAAAQNATDIATVDDALDTHIADRAAGVHGAATAATANTIAMRGTGGTLTVGAPTATGHATTKAYVDAADTATLAVANAAASAASTAQAAADTAQATANSAATTAAWTGITGKPSTYPPSLHGSAHNSGGADPITSLNASVITSGTLDIARLPAGALERLKIVTTDAARYALTKTDVQTGDTVQVTATGIMYRVVDDSKLSTAAGYVEYTAARASAVPWSGVEGKPASFAAAAHAATHKTGGTDALAPADIGAAATNHTTPLATASATGHAKPGTGMGVDAAGAFSVTYGTAANTACQGNDSRLSNARTPTAHAATHATGGTDAITPANIGAQTNLGATALGGTPSTQAFGDAASAGSSTAVARSDHKHKMPAAPTFTAVAAAGPTANATLAHGGTFIVPQVSQATTGQMTATARTLTLPAAPTVSGLGAAPANATLTDAAAASTLPATTSSTLAALLQTTRNCLKWLVARFNASGQALTAVLADKATALANGRYIHISGAVTGSSGLFDGTGPATIAATAIDVSKATAGLLPVARGGTAGATGAAACTNIGAVQKAGDTMTGKLTMNSSSTIQFDNTTTNAKINLYSTSYAMGVQSSTMYYRSAGAHRFYKGGVHQTSAGPGTGGVDVLVLTDSNASFSGAIDTPKGISAGGEIGTTSTMYARGAITTESTITATGAIRTDSSITGASVAVSGNVVSKNAAGTAQSVVAPTYIDAQAVTLKNTLNKALCQPVLRLQATRSDGTLQSTNTYIQAVCDLDTTAAGTAGDSALMIRAAGALYAGSGESAHAVRGVAAGATAIPAGWAHWGTGKITDGSEQSFFCSDNHLYFLAACQTIANSKMMRFDTGGHLIPGSANLQDLGNSSYKWRNVYGTTFQGNALTATKWATARTLSLTGAVTGSGSIDGSGNVSIATTGNTAATKPQAAAGVGQWASLEIVKSGLSFDKLKTPSGGTWAYFYVRESYAVGDVGDGQVQSVGTGAGVAAGGSTVYDGDKNSPASGFCWRVN